MNFRVQDFAWIKEHGDTFHYFHPEQDSQKGEELLALADGLRADYDPGVFINFIKMIYAIATSRDTCCTWAIDTNIDLIFKTIYEYLKQEKEK